MLGVVDYGIGNLFSLRASLKEIGVDSVVTGDAEKLDGCDRIILPGVGAFGDAADKLRERGLDAFLKSQAAAGKPILGICLGMQLLFEKSLEYGEHEGLGLLSGTVKPLRPVVPEDYKVPHMGWNSLVAVREEPLLKYCSDSPYVYYVHSFYATDCGESLSAYSDYVVKIPGIVRKDNVVGTQFHPEKSGKQGLKMLRAFTEV